MNTINDPSADDATRLSTRPHPGDGTERADTDLGDAPRLSEHGHPDNPDATVLSAKNRSAGSGRGKSRKTGKTGKKSRTNREFAMPALPERPDDEKTAGESAETPKTGRTGTAGKNRNGGTIGTSEESGTEAVEQAAETAEQADATVVRTPHTHPQTTDADDGSPSAGTDGAGTDTDSEGGTTVQRRGSVRRMRNTDVPVTPARGSVTGMIPRPDDDIDYFRRAFAGVEQNVSRVVVGKAMPIRQCITALIAGGHMLLEDNPGTGKTQLARALANSIAASFKRIQFTPDLLPSDVIGVTFYDQKTGEFEFREGPVFASIVLADEINRASPKTQSALLEVMEEQRVTVDGVTHDVPQPFIVIATQNPIEQLGTYRLPEAQMDRFLIRTSIGYPGHADSISILRQINVADRASTVGPVLSGEDVMDLRAIAENVHVDDQILEYITLLVEATRHDERIMVGASMRGALALTRCARIWAAADGRGYVVPSDVKDLAVPVLAHRLTLTPEATFSGMTCEGMVGQVLDTVPAPTLGA